ncbi:VblB5 protein (plasmid) [Bartonella grahamii as4aup]|uniref:VblB5 protein n=2 Tax=Bartonella grahamii TaxID=33045 RepID=C6AF13_BARGA|nr:type IV secretion system protein [Bartonella grahamii]ACS52139.1 VblB5 protein [Bartonella grahamii as4aup]
MKKLLLATALCAASFGFQTNAFAIMVYDPAAVGQIMKQVQQGTQQLNKLQEQIQQGKQQLDQLKSQLDQAKQLYSSLNGKPDLSALQELLNKQGNNAALPSDFNHLEQSIDGTGGGSGNTEKWKEKLLYKEPSGGSGSKEAVDAFYKQEVEKLHNRNVGQAATGQAVYEDADKKKEAISKIIEKLKNAKTAAEVQDAQTQLAAIQAILQAEALQTQATSMIQQAQSEAEAIRIREEASKRYQDYANQLRGH